MSQTRAYGPVARKQWHKQTLLADPVLNIEQIHLPVEFGADRWLKQAT